MTVTIDQQSGFCWGVVRTVQIAEDQLAATRDDRNVYVLGHIIHNPREIERLASKGLKTITVDDFPSIANSGAKVLIRAHGEPPETYRKALQHGIEIIDATCPVVTKLQERVRKFYDQDYQIVIFGKRDHAEVLGVRGVVHDQCVCVLTVDEALANVDLGRKTVLFSQTTMDRPTFNLIRDALKSRIAELVVDTMEEIATEFHAKDTICGQVSGREAQLARFAASNDVMIFVAGRASSNGKVLYNVAKAANPRTYFVESVDEMQDDWFTAATTVGISGATSTPKWVMDDVKHHIEQRTAMQV
ncbi:MAG: 4-hydroxy-3-methylbut-2-enyl diphosphate reductase [Candidatus Kapabacteria bacterium]|nr:4-hydroxy-3-methylbut-2-enyl diphosphate reductase [Candidatus Kapabacteria bacterium]